MPPKKQVEEKNPPIIGRLGTNLRIGILGLPNVGKSTFFNVLTKSEAEAANFPFCTIDPNEARVAVSDERFDWLVDHFKPLSRVPAYLNVTDIAGLAFLSHVGACDALFHLCRAFDDDDVTHVEGEVNPTRDLDIISEELRLKDLAYLDGALDKLEKLAIRGNDKSKKPEYETLQKVKELLDGKQFVRHHVWSEKDIEGLNKHLFLTAKPIKNKYLPKIKEGGVLIPFSGALELKLVEMEPEEREKYLKEQGATSALDKIVKTGYKALQLEYFFTAGKDEVRAWTIQHGTKAPQAAGRIHTDFEKGFIMAEVYKAADIIELGSENAVKSAGQFNAGAGLTKGKPVAK
ncbi:Obg-like ATPase 1 [Aphelenchoides fujianensis]|nr:Obg-like ATPase 1 [Aphelenchoides fujianensis]